MTFVTSNTPDHQQSSPTGDVREPREQFALPPGCDEGYISANGQRLHYVAAGAGPLAILLHGFPEFWYSWRSNIAEIATVRRVVALDMRGYNLSDKPADGYDIATLCEDIRGVIDALGEQQADIIGHDWGGIIAWAFAMREPEYTSSLVVLNAPHPVAMWRELRNPRQLARSSYVGFFQLQGIAERAFSADHFGVVWRTFRSADRAREWLRDEDIQRFVDAIERPGALTAALNYYRQLVRRGAANIGVARVIHAPTLLLWGEQDPYLGIELFEGLDAWAPHLRVVLFPEAGHWLNQQQPDSVNAEIVSFLTEAR